MTEPRVPLMALLALAVAHLVGLSLAATTDEAGPWGGVLVAGGLVGVVAAVWMRRSRLPRGHWRRSMALTVVGAGLYAVDSFGRAVSIVFQDEGPAWPALLGVVLLVVGAASSAVLGTRWDAPSSAVDRPGGAGRPTLEE